MAYISLKISNVIDNIDVLKLRLSSIKNRQNFVKKLLLLINEGNTEEILKELLFRVEYYASVKVLNYTKQDLNIITSNIHTLGIPAIVGALLSKIQSSNKPTTVESKIELPSNVLIAVKEYWKTHLGNSDPQAFAKFANIVVAFVEKLSTDTDFLNLPLTSGIDFAEIDEFLVTLVARNKVPVSVKYIVEGIEFVFGLLNTPEYKEFTAIYEPV